MSGAGLETRQENWAEQTLVSVYFFLFLAGCLLVGPFYMLVGMIPYMVLAMIAFAILKVFVWLKWASFWTPQLLVGCFTWPLAEGMTPLGGGIGGLQMTPIVLFVLVCGHVGPALVWYFGVRGNRAQFPHAPDRVGPAEGFVLCSCALLCLLLVVVRIRQILPTLG